MSTYRMWQNHKTKEKNTLTTNTLYSPRTHYRPLLVCIRNRDVFNMFFFGRFCYCLATLLLIFCLFRFSFLLHQTFAWTQNISLNSRCFITKRIKIIIIIIITNSNEELSLKPVSHTNTHFSQIKCVFFHFSTTFSN